MEAHTCTDMPSYLTTTITAFISAHLFGPGPLRLSFSDYLWKTPPSSSSRHSNGRVWALIVTVRQPHLERDGDKKYGRAGKYRKPQTRPADLWETWDVLVRPPWRFCVSPSTTTTLLWMHTRAFLSLCKWCGCWGSLAFSNERLWLVRCYNRCD